MNQKEEREKEPNSAKKKKKGNLREREVFWHLVTILD